MAKQCKEQSSKVAKLMKLKMDNTAAKLVKWGYKMWSPNEKIRRFYINDVPAGSKLYYDVLSSKWVLNGDKAALEKIVEKFENTDADNIPSSLRDARLEDFAEKEETLVVNKYTGYRGVISFWGDWVIDFRKSSGDFIYTSNIQEILDLCYIEKEKY